MDDSLINELLLDEPMDSLSDWNIDNSGKVGFFSVAVSVCCITF